MDEKKKFSSKDIVYNFEPKALSNDEIKDKAIFPTYKTNEFAPVTFDSGGLGNVAKWYIKIKKGKHAELYVDDKLVKTKPIPDGDVWIKFTKNGDEIE